MEKVVVIMPTWNEEGNIKDMIGELTKNIFPGIDADIKLLVVDNHSTDKTGEIVEKASELNKDIYLIQQKNSGLGWAYVTGMRYAMDTLKADAVIEMDADFQHPPRFVKPMIDAYLNGAEYVIGSRYIKGGSVPKDWAFTRKAVSYFGNLFIRICLMNFKIHDLTTGFRLTKVKGVLDKIVLEDLHNLDKFSHKIDLLYQSLKNSKKTVEVPLEFASRTKEKSKFNWREFASSFQLAIILGIKDKIRFVKFAVVGGTGFVVNYLGLELLKYLGLSTYLASLFATEASIISNFTFNNIWTFKDKTIKSFKYLIVQFLKFNLSSLFAVIVQPLIVSGFSRWLGDTPLVHFGALVFALAFVIVPYNYTVYNLFIWRTWKMPFFKKDKQDL